MTKVSIMARLKQSTEEQHAAIERVLNPLSPDFTRQSYCRLLQRFYGYYLPWEEICRAVVDPILPGFFALREKTPLLEQDLCSLGYPDLRTIARCPYVVPLRTPGEALGSMYVTEGSTLGGRILARHFSAALGIRPDSGGMFFAGYGDRTGAMWRAFSEVVEASVGPQNVDTTIRSAQLTFDSLSRWLGG